RTRPAAEDPGAARGEKARVRRRRRAHRHRWTRCRSGGRPAGRAVSSGSPTLPTGGRGGGRGRNACAGRGGGARPSWRADRGGGTVLDISGMAAATYARGIALVNVPTTLLAMVDAGLGGKVGINHAGVKNLAGAFHHPRVVAVDPAALASAPCPAIRGGLAEI